MRPAEVGGHQQRGLVRLGAGVGEEHPRVRDAGDAGDLLGQLDLLPDQVQRRGVHDAGAQLPLDRLGDLRDVVADHVGQHAAHQVFLREYVMNAANHPVSTGKLLGGIINPDPLAPRWQTLASPLARRASG